MGAGVPLHAGLDEVVGMNKKKKTMYSMYSASQPIIGGVGMSLLCTALPDRHPFPGTEPRGVTGSVGPCRYEVD